MIDNNEIKIGDLLIANGGSPNHLRYYIVTNIVKASGSFIYKVRSQSSWLTWILLDEIEYVVPKGSLEYTLNYFEVETKEIK